MPQVLNKQWALSTKKAKQTNTRNIKAGVHKLKPTQRTHNEIHQTRQTNPTCALYELIFGKL